MSDTLERVDLVVNVFERTYRRALTPGALARIQTSHRHEFGRRVVLINNVSDSADAMHRVQRLIDAGEVDDCWVVSERLDDALTVTGLNRADLEPMLHYSDAPLVAVTLPGSPWLLYWDADATLSQPVAWIDAAIRLLQEDPRLLAANPSWELPDADGRRPSVESECVEVRAGFALGYGFSDQVFLARRADLARPIYRQRCISKITYPAAHRGAVFEARLNAHMRHHGRLRATALDVSYVIDESSSRSAYPALSLTEKARYLRNGITLRAMSASPWLPRCLRHTWIET